MNRVLAFDQGNTTGWAFADDDGEITFGTWHFDTTLSEAARWVCAGRVISDTIVELQPQVVAYERPFFRGKASLQLYGYAVAIEMMAYMHEVPCLAVHGASIKAHAGVRAGKPVAEARARGWEVDDDHQADALFLLDYVRVKAAWEGQGGQA